MENTSGKKRFNLKQSIKNLFVELKTHWKTPPEGRYVPYKEYISIFTAVGGNYSLSYLLGMLSFGTDESPESSMILIAIPISGNSFITSRILMKFSFPSSQ